MDGTTTSTEQLDEFYYFSTFFFYRVNATAKRPRTAVKAPAMVLEAALVPFPPAFMVEQTMARSGRGSAASGAVQSALVNTFMDSSLAMLRIQLYGTSAGRTSGWTARIISWRTASFMTTAEANQSRPSLGLTIPSSRKTALFFKNL